MVSLNGLMFCLFKHQSIVRYSEGWEQSLRYRQIEPDKICGLKKLLINNNMLMGNDSLQLIIDALSDDEWMKGKYLKNWQVLYRNLI